MARIVPAATEVSALTTLAAIMPLWAMITYETLRYGDGRYRLRHGLDPEPGA